MKRGSMWLVLGLFVLGSVVTGCAKDEEDDTGSGGGGGGGGEDTGTEIDTETDSEMFLACAACNDFRGVDILVVVDNSASMAEEQQILATGFFTLINSLVVPTEDWEYDAATSVRIAIVSSDMGLQYGDDSQVPADMDEVRTCEALRGNNGVFLTEAIPEVTLDSEQIKCDEGGGQCPTEDWSCIGGYCVAPGDASQAAVDCPTLGSDERWAYQTPSGELAKTVACMAQVGTGGCGVEQQLKAGVSALSRDDQSDFIRDGHLLAVMVISDEEDCSIKNADLFASEQWNDSEIWNTACNYPEENEQNFLYNVGSFRRDLVALKDGMEHAVLFAAIVGVPTGNDSPCQGLGSEIPDCLADDSMQLEVMGFVDEASGTEYSHFRPACEREVDGEVVTSARPGRRYVKLAQRFGCLGYVYSICNEDWSDAMSEIARIIAECITVMV